MGMRFTWTLLACSAFALLLGQPVLAQDAPNDWEQASIDGNAVAIASATSYPPIAPGAALDVSSADNSELANDTVELTSGTLKQNGFTIARDAPHALNAGFRLDRFATGHLIDEKGAGAQPNLH